MANSMPSHRLDLGAPFLVHGGAEKQFRYLVEVLADLNTNIHIHILSSLEGNPSAKDIVARWPPNVAVTFYDADVLHLKEQPSSYLRLLARLARQMRSAEIVYFYSAFFLPLIPFLKISRTRVIYSERILSPQTRKRTPLYKLAALADRFIVNSASLADHFSTTHKNVLLVHNKVEPIGWERKLIDPSVAIISRYDPWKNIGFALSALKNDSETTINVYGSGNSSYRATLEREHATNCRVRFHGLENISRIYEMNDVVVHPSLAEGTPNVLIEAMASKKPILASNIRENLDTGLDHTCLFDPSDPKSLRDTLFQWRSLPDNFKDKVLDKNARTAALRYSGQKFQATIISLFTSLWSE